MGGQKGALASRQPSGGLCWSENASATSTEAVKRMFVTALRSPPPRRPPAMHLPGPAADHCRCLLVSAYTTCWLHKLHPKWLNAPRSLRAQVTSTSSTCAASPSCSGHIHLSTFGREQRTSRAVIPMTSRQGLRAVVVCAGVRVARTHRCTVVAANAAGPKSFLFRFVAPGSRQFRKSPDTAVPKTHLTIQNPDPEKPSASRAFGSSDPGGICRLLWGSRPREFFSFRPLANRCMDSGQPYMMVE